MFSSVCTVTASGRFALTVPIYIGVKKPFDSYSVVLGVLVCLSPHIALSFFNAMLVIYSKEFAVLFSTSSFISSFRELVSMSGISLSVIS